MGHANNSRKTHIMPYLHLAIVAEVVGTSALKASGGFTLWKGTIYELWQMAD